MKELPPVEPRPDTRGWPVVTEPPPEIWLGSFDEDGNRIDVDGGNATAGGGKSPHGPFAAGIDQEPPATSRP